MNSSNQNYLGMCLKVKNFYTANKTTFDSVKNLSNLFIIFSLMVDTLNTEFENSIAYTNKYTIERAKKRADLEKSVLRITDAIKAHYEGIRKKSAYTLTSHCPVSISTIEEEELINHATDLQDIAIPLVKDLEVHGISAKDIQDLSNNLTLFVIAMPMHMHAIEKRQKARMGFVKTTAEIENFLENDLDPLIKIFVNDKPEITQQYAEARKVTDAETPGVPNYTGPVKGAGVNLIASLPYHPDREFRMQVTGGNALWGFGNDTDEIEYSRPIAVGEDLSIKSRIIGPKGNLLLIQNIDPEQPVTLKVWVQEG